MTIQAVVFDLGKVLVDFDYGIAARRLADQSGKSAEEVRAVIDQSPLLFRYESGAMSTNDFFIEVRQKIGYRGSFNQFAAAFADIFSEIPEMIALQAELKGRGVRTYILSNTNEIAVGHIRRRFPFFSGFSGYVFSYAEQSLKPQPRIYEAAEARAGARAGQVLFLDDRAENIEAARQRGWQTLWHQSPGETIPRVRELLG